MIKLLTVESEFESAKKLGFETTTSLKGKYAMDFAKDIIIRWGKSALYYADKHTDLVKDFPNVINKSSAIRLNCNKELALEKLSKVVNTPRIFKRDVPAGVTAVVRPQEHSCGIDFSIEKGPFRVEDGYFAVEFIETDKEFRVWFCGDAMFCCLRVPLTEEHKKLAPCRSEWGYRYLAEVPPLLKRDSIKAIKAIGLDVGALDVLYKDKKYFFLENNSSASVDTNTLIRFYKENLQKLAKQRFPQFV